MRVRTEKRKTLEHSKQVCLQVRDKKTQVIESLVKIAEIMDAESSLKRLPGDIRKAKEVIKDSNNGFAELQPQLEEKTAYNDKLKKEVDKIGAKFDPLKSLVIQLKSKAERQEQKISAVDGLTKKVAQLKLEKDGVDSRVRVLGPEIGSLKNETSNMQSKLTADNEELQTLKPEKEQFITDTESLSEKIKGLGDLEVKKKEFNQLESENRKTVEEINKLKSDLDNCEQLKANVESETNSINEEAENIAKEVGSLKDRAESLSKTVIPKEDVDKLQTQLNEVTKERDGLRDKTANIEAEIEKHMQNKGDIIEQVENARADLESTSNEFSKFKERVELYKNDPDQLERLKNKIPELEKIKGEYAKRAENAQEELKHLNNAVDIMKTELMAYKEAMEEIGNLLVSKFGEPA